MWKGDKMPVTKNEDGTVNCEPPWGFTELLEVMNYDCHPFIKHFKKKIITKN